MFMHDPGRRSIALCASCLVHLGLITVLLLVRPWAFSAEPRQIPVLPAELVAPEDRSEPVKPPPQPRPEPRRLRLPKLIEAPLPKLTEAPSPTPETPPPPPAPVAAEIPPVVQSPPVAEPGPRAVAQSSAPPADDALSRSGPPPATTTAAAVTALVPAASSSSDADAIALGPSADHKPAAVAALTETGVSRDARPQGGYQVRPSYPATARRLGIQGTTLLKVHVLVDGRVGDIVVQESAGHADLDRAATDAVRRWRFDPARRGSDAVSMWVLLPVEFRLK